MTFVQQLHLPHPQPLELVKVSEENENRLRRSGSRCLDDGLLIQMHQQTMLQ